MKEEHLVVVVTWQCRYLEVKWKSCVKVWGSRGHLLPPPELICLFPCHPSVVWALAPAAILLEPHSVF